MAVVPASCPGPAAARQAAMASAGAASRLGATDSGLKARPLAACRTSSNGHQLQKASRMNSCGFQPRAAAQGREQDCHETSCYTEDRLLAQAFLERLFDMPVPTSWPEPVAHQQDAVFSGAFKVELEERPSSSSKEPGNEKGSRERGNGGKSDDYYANVGYAIRTLREDIPLLFMRNCNCKTWERVIDSVLQSLHPTKFRMDFLMQLADEIYRDDVVFKDPRNTFRGIDNYKLIFWSLRFHGRIFFRTAFVEIKRLWQPEDKCIRCTGKLSLNGFRAQHASTICAEQFPSQDEVDCSRLPTSSLGGRGDF